MVDIRRKGKVSVIPGQPPKDAVLIEVTKADERWNTYDLDDGTQIKMRLVLVEVWCVENEYDAEGNPMYVVNGQTIVKINSPDSLKKR